MSAWIGRYADVLRTRGVGRVVCGAWAAYAAFAAMTLAVVLTVRDFSGSFGVAGAAASALGAGAMVCAPLRGRSIDRYGQTPVMIPLGLLHAGAVWVLALAGGRLPDAGLVALAAVVGAAFPSVFACMRSVLAQAFPDAAARQAAYALESTMQDSAFIAGPLLAAAAMSFGSARSALALLGALSLAGVLLFALSPLSRSWAADARRVARSSPLGSPGVRTLVVSMGTLGLAVGSVQVAVPAAAVQSGSGRSLAGVLVAMLAVGSIVGGLWYGGRTWRAPVPVRYVILLCTLGAALSLTPLTVSVWALALALLIAGGSLAPLFVCTYSLIDDVAPRGTGTEAFTWLASSQAAGVALSSAAAGFITDHASVGWAFALAPVGAFSGALVAWVGRSRLSPREPAMP
jgi:MFS family permease